MTNSIEREQVEQVFGLTGGELSDSAWSYVHETSHLSTDPENTCIPRDDKGRSVGAYPFEPDYYVARGAFRYWYEGAPEYTTEYTERGSTSNADGFDVRTVVTCALFGMPPEVMWDASTGNRWRRVAFYQSSGETECPGQYEDENKVTPDHIGPDADPSDANATCVLCDEEIGTEHGFIYLGDGWGEAVYVRETPRVHFQIIDHGCDGEQYFPGCGTGKLDNVITGIGDSAREAAEDAASQMDTVGISGDVSMTALENAIHEMDRAPSFNVDDPDISPEWHHYVSIRWRIERY